MTISKKRAAALIIFIILAVLALTVASPPTKAERFKASVTIVTVDPLEGSSLIPANQNVVGFSCVAAPTAPASRMKTTCYVLTQ